MLLIASYWLQGVGVFFRLPRFWDTQNCFLITAYPYDKGNGTQGKTGNYCVGDREHILSSGELEVLLEVGQPARPLHLSLPMLFQSKAPLYTLSPNDILSLNSERGTLLAGRGAKDSSEGSRAES